MADGLSASAAGWLACHGCGALHPLAQEGHDCPRCGATLHRRKPYSLQRAWAWLISGLILYIPANLYPIMSTSSLGRTLHSTIIGGVVTLFEHGSYLVAGVIFIASVMIPLLKFLVMSYLLLGIQFRAQASAAERLWLYRMLELVGRWSMIDVFVVAILAALVQMGGIAKVIPGPGADAFAAMVVCTMLAATALDPRLLWDRD